MRSSGKWAGGWSKSQTRNKTRERDKRARRGAPMNTPQDNTANTPQTSTASSGGPLVSVIMGSKSDWATMRFATEQLAEFEIPYEARVVSAHRTPRWMCEYAETAEARGLEVIIAGAGGAAHLPGMVAAQTVLPVLGVPVSSKSLAGMDSLLSIVQMPGGIPVGTLAIGEAGGPPPALLGVRVLAPSPPPPRPQPPDFPPPPPARVHQ